MTERKNLTQILQNTNKKLNTINKKLRGLDKLEIKAKELEKIKEAIEGLTRTRKDSRSKDFYEGKYSPSYRYVDSIQKDEIIATKEFKPGMMYPCPKCGASVPVLRYCFQEYDSPEGDSWVTNAIIICCDKIHELKRLVHD